VQLEYSCVHLKRNSCPWNLCQPPADQTFYPTPCLRQIRSHPNLISHLEPAPVPPLPEPVPAYGVVLAAQVKGRWLTPVSEVPSEDCSCTESTLGEDQGKAEGVAR